MPEMPKEIRELQKFGDEEIEVIYRRTRPREGNVQFLHPALLPCVTVKDGIRIERDVAIPMRDGIIVYTDIYRPEGAANLPAIITCSPFGKRASYAPLPEMLPHGVPPGTVSPMTKYESPDPAYWCHYGYAVINPDARGVGNSGGKIACFGTQEGRDGADIVEWVAAREWSNGKVAMTGNSWVAMAAWFTAAEQPPHLTCIAPWEGTSDIYREFICCGGFPEVGFNNKLIGRLYGPGYVEDYISMALKYTLMNSYWEDKIVNFDNIEIPVYVTAGWLHFHLRGSIEAFRRISSPKKWLRAHRDFEWTDAYTPENLEELRRFFDRYLKDIRNGWELTPRIRLDVMDAGEFDYQLRRPEREFPLARTQYKKLFLDAGKNRLSSEPVKQEDSVSYEAAQGLTTFDFRFDDDTELTGYFKLRLWVEAEGSDDMDLFITVMKLDERGEFMPMIGLSEPHPGLPGKLRVSHRELDEKRSTPHQPYHTHRREQLLKSGEIVPVEIEIWPTSLIWHKGQQLRVRVAGHYIRKEGWFEPFAWQTRNRGNHIIHTGGKYDSHLLVPVVPPRYSAGRYIYR